MWYNRLTGKLIYGTGRDRRSQGIHYEGSEMKRFIILILAMFFEILACMLVCAGISDRKYDEWKDVQASVLSVSSNIEKTSVLGDMTEVTRIELKSFESDEQWSIEFKNFQTDLSAGDRVIVKYDPADRSRIVYPEYEEYGVSVKRKKTIMIFFCALMFSVWIYWVKNDSFASVSENHIYGHPVHK